MNMRPTIFTTIRGATIYSICTILSLLTIKATENLGNYTLDESQHPKNDLIPYYSVEGTVIIEDIPHTSSSKDIPSVSSEIKFSIGKRSGSRSEVFGRIEDIVFSQGIIYVLDSQYHEVRIYRTDGQIEETFGSFGSGPNQFQYPEGLALAPEGKLIVADRSRKIMHLTRGVEGTNLRSTFRIDLEPDDICNMGKEIYVQGYNVNHDDNLIHVYSEKGERIRSIGKGYMSSNSSVNETINRGSVACSEKTNTILVAPRLLPMVYAYSPDGTLKWASRIANFNPKPVIQTTNERGTTRLKRPNVSGDMVDSITIMSEDYVLVQRVRVYPDEQKINHYSYLLSLESGQGYYIGDNVKGKVQYIKDDTIFTSQTLPYPKVNVY